MSFIKSLYAFCAESTDFGSSGLAQPETSGRCSGGSPGDGGGGTGGCGSSGIGDGGACGAPPGPVPSIWMPVVLVLGPLGPADGAGGPLCGTAGGLAGSGGGGGVNSCDGGGGAAGVPTPPATRRCAPPSSSPAVSRRPSAPPTRAAPARPCVARYWQPARAGDELDGLDGDLARDFRHPSWSGFGFLASP